MNLFEISFGIFLLIVIGIVIYMNREKVKKSLGERIETNAVKIPNLNWKDKSGKVYTEDIIIKRSRIPLIGDWSRIYPSINEDGKVNWVNAIFGGKKNFIKLLIFLGIIALFFFAISEVFSQYTSLKEFCEPYLNLKQ